MISTDTLKASEEEKSDEEDLEEDDHSESDPDYDLTRYIAKKSKINDSAVSVKPRGRPPLNPLSCQLETLLNCKFCGHSNVRFSSHKNHERYCKSNPNRKMIFCSICQVEVPSGEAITV